MSTRNSLEHFLYFYARFQHAQQRELVSYSNALFAEEQEENHSKQVNQSDAYAEIAKEIESLSISDPFLLHLHAKVRSKFCSQQETIDLACQALQAAPLNWECWMLLASCIRDVAHYNTVIERLTIDEKCWFMQHAFRLKVMTRLQENFGDCMASIKLMRLRGLTKFLFLDMMEGILHYNERDFDNAERIFGLIVGEQDQFMLEVYDYLSNIWYIREEQEKLAILAQQAYQIDPLRPESCCVAGNFWSMRQEHTLAIQQFQKALKLDPDYLSAWVLMGHEYLEQRATSSAIESYRNALKRDPNDYRAWYGLGQTYELLKMNSYALYYYRTATRCKPRDSRMWSALSSVYFQLGELQHAITALNRAYRLEPLDSSVALRLAKMLLKQNNSTEALHIYEKLLTNDSFWTQCSSHDISNVLWQLAIHRFRNNQLDEAKDLCMKIFQYGGMERESAQELLSVIEQGKNGSN